MDDCKFYKLRWYNKLLFRIPLIFVILFTVMVVMVAVVMETVGKKRLENQAYKLITQAGNTIVAELNSRIDFTKGVAESLANAIELLPADANLWMQVIPNIINCEEGQLLIAGGGVWPEPYKFSNDTERRSFFWGRDKNGGLKYYDDYNKADGPGYHNEEWYVPSRYLKEGECFWSGSYMAPYSHQPMVTCTASMFRDGQFYGVSTIDLKLEGLGELFEQAASYIGGYAFIVDRAGKFLFFPDNILAKNYSLDKSGDLTEEYLYSDELAEKAPQFRPIASAISDLNKMILDKANGFQLAQFKTVDDILLNKSCNVSIFHVPDTHWKVVIVVPLDQALAASKSIRLIIVWLLIGTIALVMLGGFVALRYSMVRPLASMANQLQELSYSEPSTPGHIEIKGQNELGALAYWFNLRSDQLAMTLAKLQNVRDELEERVSQRTKELEITNYNLEKTVLKLDKMNYELKDFVYIASHDLCEPLRKISAFGELVKRSLGGKLSDDDRENLEFMFDGAKRMRQMIEGLLLYSRLSTRVADFETVDLNQVIQELREEDFSGLLQDERGSIEIERPLPKINGDPGQIKQLLRILIDNGLKYCDKDVLPRVIIRHKYQKDKMVRVEVQDNGIGIRQDYHEDIFTIFKRLHTQEQYSGVGVGLAVCKKIVERHRGQIGVESKLGKGSTFWFSIQLACRTVAVDEGVASQIRKQELKNI